MDPVILVPIVLGLMRGISELVRLLQKNAGVTEAHKEEMRRESIVLVAATHSLTPIPPPPV